MPNIVKIKTQCLNARVFLADKYLLCDAYKILCDVWPAKYRFPELTFCEIKALWYMIELRKGYIIIKEPTIEYILLMGDEQYTFFCNPFIDAIMRRHSIYPDWLDIPYMDEMKLPFTLDKKRL